jgi:hypothetical protein
MSLQPPLSDIGRFYKQLDDFKSKLLLIFQQFEKNQEILDLKRYYDKVVIAKEASIRLPIELFYTYVVSVYATYILTRDEQFFLGKMSGIGGHAMASDEEESYRMVMGSKGDVKHDLIFVSQIKNVWQSLQPKVKNNIWDYIQVLCVLAEKVVGGNAMVICKQKLLVEGKIQ